MKKEKKKKPDAHARGYLNKLMIVSLLKKDLRNGLKQNEIINKSKLTKPTVFRILRELLSEHKIFKLNNLYFPEFDDDFRFAYFLSGYINFFLTKILENKGTLSNLMDSPYDPKLIAEDPLDNSIVEFANVIGGLITYILIECRSLYGDDRESAKIKELIDNIFKGLIWENIFNQFGILFRDTYRNMQTTDDRKGFDMLSKSLMNVYPKLYDTLESNRIKFFKDWIQDNPDNNLYKNCNHEWKERHMFRCGKFKECVYCHFRKLN
jgi:hypothetical protein